MVIYPSRGILLSKFLLNKKQFLEAAAIYPKLTSIRLSLFIFVVLGVVFHSTFRKFIHVYIFEKFVIVLKRFPIP